MLTRWGLKQSSGAISLLPLYGPTPGVDRGTHQGISLQKKWVSSFRHLRNSRMIASSSLEAIS
jgi:hypothetical protein